MLLLLTFFDAVLFKKKKEKKKNLKLEVPVTSDICNLLTIWLRCSNGILYLISTDNMPNTPNVIILIFFFSDIYIFLIQILFDKVF